MWLLNLLGPFAFVVELEVFFSFFFLSFLFSFLFLRPGPTVLPRTDSSLQAEAVPYTELPTQPVLQAAPSRQLQSLSLFTTL